MPWHPRSRRGSTPAGPGTRGGRGCGSRRVTRVLRARVAAMDPADGEVRGLATLLAWGARGTGRPDTLVPDRQQVLSGVLSLPERHGVHGRGDLAEHGERID